MVGRAVAVAATGCAHSGQELAVAESRERLFKTRAHLVRHARSYRLQRAESQGVPDRLDPDWPPAYTRRTRRVRRPGCTSGPLPASFRSALSLRAAPLAAEARRGRSTGSESC